jgi:hypothetical protein
MSKAEIEMRKNAFKNSLLFDWVKNHAEHKVPGEYRLMAQAMEEVAATLRYFASDAEQNSAQEHEAETIDERDRP